MSWSSIVSARLECRGTYQPLPLGRAAATKPTVSCRIPAVINAKESLRLSSCLYMYVYAMRACDVQWDIILEMTKRENEIVLIEKGKR